MDQKGRVLSDSKLRLLALLEKAQTVVRFAKPSECDAALVNLCHFCQNGARARDTVLATSEFAKQPLSSLVTLACMFSAEEQEELQECQKPKKDVCCCQPFEEKCASDQTSILCQCCAEPEATARTATMSQSFCAECLCSLSKSPLLFEAALEPLADWSRPENNSLWT